MTELKDTSKDYQDMVGVRDTSVAPASLADFLGLTDLPATEKDAEAELWAGMPTFNNKQNKPVRQLTVNFGTEENYQEFIKALSLKKITAYTKSIWYPEVPLLENTLYRFIDEEEV